MRRHVAVFAVALLHLLSPGNSATAPRDLVYPIDEEWDVGRSIAHLAHDAGLNNRYPPEVAGSLRFRFLSPAPPYIGLDESTGRLFVADRIDRDRICRPEVKICSVQQDVAVQPVQYFSIIKVSKQLATMRCTSLLLLLRLVSREAPDSIVSSKVLQKPHAPIPMGRR